MNETQKINTKAKTFILVLFLTSCVECEESDEGKRIYVDSKIEMKVGVKQGGQHAEGHVSL